VINQGGAELVRYRVSDDAIHHGIEVGETFHPGYPVPGSGDHFALLAFPFAEKEPIPIFLVARDEAENQSKAPVPYDLVNKTWRQRQINIDDGFIQRTVLPLIAQSSEIDESGNPLDDFLAANTALRNITNQRLEEITQDTRPQRLWRGTFKQMSNSQVQALFADRRDYYYNGNKVDVKDHLGYDLAATKNYPVGAGNTGVVIFAGDLGLYGNTVIIDHGYGLQSLYGHLASFTVEVGDDIKKGMIVGYTGSTGMAGGDHLHFSMLLHGQQVNPLEWWDRDWIKLHIDDRLTQG
jgi:murein DD-endopeptidase MepM/ murein hydrolase activator NlpD